MAQRTSYPESRGSLHATGIVLITLANIRSKKRDALRDALPHTGTQSNCLSKERVMNYRVLGLDPQAFADLPSLDDASLRERRALRTVADSQPGFPDRLSLTDVAPGTPVWLIHHTHQPADTPYHASHAIYVAPGSVQERVVLNHLPPMITGRLISLRAFSADHQMVDAEVAEGKELEPLIERFLAQPSVAYLHAHFARRGCYAARIERA